MASDNDSILDTFFTTMIEGMDKQSQQRLYIISRSGSGEAQYVLLNDKRTEIESYGVKYETWKVIKNVSDFGVAVVDNVLYVIGGYDVINCRHLHRVLKYDPYDFSWRECSPLMKARAKFGVCVLDGKIYVCGGERSDGRVSCSCEIYDPETDRWAESGLLAAPRKNHCCTAFESDMYCAGGDFGTRSHDNFWIYENDHWEELDVDYPLSMPKCIDRFAMCSAGRKIYFIGGVSSKVTSGDTKFTTERGIFSYSHNISAKRPSKSHIHGLQGDIISPWSTRYPSMVRPRMNCAAHVVGDLTSVLTAVLEVPRRHDADKIKYYLKWVMW